MCVSCRFSDPICTKNMVKSLHVILLTASSAGDRITLPKLSHSANQCIFPRLPLQNKSTDMGVWIHYTCVIKLKSDFNTSQISVLVVLLWAEVVEISISTLPDSSPSLCLEIVRKYIAGGVGRIYHFQAHRCPLEVFFLHIQYCQWNWKSGVPLLKQTLWKTEHVYSFLVKRLEY